MMTFMASEQEILFAIVKTWNIKSKPEFRGFRCANCQEYMQSAWHHWLHSKGFITPIHFCEACEEAFKSGKIEISSKEGSLDRNNPGFFYGGRVLEIMQGIVNSWTFPLVKKPFSCDLCTHDVKDARAWHVWIDLGEKMVEEHFCKSCGKKVGVE